MSLPFPYAGYSEDISRRVRVLFNGATVVDTQTPKLVWEHPYYPIYYFPHADLRIEHDSLRNPVPATAPNQHTTYDLVVGSRTSPAALTHIHSGPLTDYVKIGTDKADMWLEEDERVFGHPRDPYKRVVILPSSRHVRVEIDGVEVANTTRGKLLYETGLPVRTYIPHADVRVDLLRDDVGRRTSCPYKGDASYYIVRLPSGEKVGLAWWYKAPLPESAEIRGHIAFYDEKVDVWVDGVKQARPVTKFS